MKVRQGYVSNSSSSSFFVAFGDPPESVEELKEMLFGDVSHYHWDGDLDEMIPTIDIAKVIWHDMQPQLPDGVGPYHIAAALEHGYVLHDEIDRVCKEEGIPELDSALPRAERWKVNSIRKIVAAEAALNKANEIMVDLYVDGKVESALFHFRYASDGAATDAGPEGVNRSEIERTIRWGNVFGKLTHKVVNEQ